MQITLLSHIEYIMCFSCSLFEKSAFLNSLKIMKKSPITEYSGPCSNHTKYDI